MKLEMNMEATLPAVVPYRKCPQCHKARKTVIQEDTEVCKDCGYVFLAIRRRRVLEEVTSGRP